MTYAEELEIDDDTEQATHLSHPPVHLCHAPNDPGQTVLRGPFRGQSVGQVAARLALHSLMLGCLTHQSSVTNRPWWRCFRKTCAVTIYVIPITVPGGTCRVTR
jgi:hypothetical protein